MSSNHGRASRMRRSTTADQIKQLILARELAPGDPLLTESELCETLDVSRSSLREAIRTLTTLDIVDVRHGHGTFVGNMSLDPMVETLVFRGVLSPEGPLQALREVIDVRLALDLSMADQVVAGFDEPESLQELERLVTEMNDNAARGESFLEADRAFHTQLFAKIDNHLVGQLVGAFWDVHAAVLPRLGITEPDDVLLSVKAHSDMLAAVRARDTEAYRLAVIEHYRPLKRALAHAS